MREIKYRAWDGESVRYDVTGFEHGIKNEMAGIMLDGDYYSLDEHSLSAAMNNRHAVAMQFTGLKDKNGKEYYTEDVGEFDNGDRFIIKMEEWLEVFVEWIGEPKCEDQARDLYRISQAKLIGNIYENPELLDPKEAL